ncbi:Cadherin- hmr-1 [Parelaphostrongylus tenuis]|uniref:Cadherin- hmr-1 n=1 Tax=Parelaphostrongylus tenuis TaxID=148309 RepID=A0AAD5QDL3_PARTN|nr:Cadherin- hmr-1 [Parelaphostrongylus tenuis]
MLMQCMEHDKAIRRLSLECPLEYWRALDRELPSEREFVIEVHATDHGTPPREGAANVTVKVLDKNDNAPSFERSHYEAVVDETIAVGSAVISVSATDPDDEAIDNLFTYTLADDSKYFYMTTDRDSSESYVGVLRVKQVEQGANNGKLFYSSQTNQLEDGV